MARIASLLGIEEGSGKIITIKAGHVDGVVAERSKVIDLLGVIKQGKAEVKLSEMICLSNHTAGGELKPRRKFKHLEKVAKPAKKEVKEEV